MSLEVIIAALVSVLAGAWGLWRAHVRAVITAEQRGRLLQSQIAEGVRLTTEAGARAVEARGEASAHAAEASTSAEPVTRAEVEAWAKPPKGPAS